MKNVFLIDLDGTLYNGKKAMPYAPQFIKFLNDNKYVRCWAAVKAIV